MTPVGTICFYDDTGGETTQAQLSAGNDTGAPSLTKTAIRYYAPSYDLTAITSAVHSIVFDSNYINSDQSYRIWLGVGDALPADLAAWNSQTASKPNATFIESGRVATDVLNADITSLFSAVAFDDDYLVLYFDHNPTGDGDGGLNFSSPSLSLNDGMAPIEGSATIQLQGVSVTATGESDIEGAATIQLQGVTVSSQGGQVQPEGSAAIQLEGVTVAATGEIAVAATATITLQGVTVSATGESEILAVATIQLDGVTAVSTGIVGDPIYGSATIQLDGVTVSASGESAITAASTIQLEGVTVTAVGVVSTESFDLFPSELFDDELFQYQLIA